MRFHLVLVCFFLVFFLMCCPLAQAQRYFVTIGTGGITGVYYPTGGAIAKLVNQRKKDHGVSVMVEPTGGSVFNINAIMLGDFEFGIVQADRQYQATRGTAEWQRRGPQHDLRSVFALHPESLVLVAAVDAGIVDITDLRGKRVNIGNIGSGHRQNALDALQAAGLDYSRDLIAEGFKAAEAPHLIQEGLLDAFFYTVGHPAGAIRQAAAGPRKVRVATMSGYASLVAKYPYYTKDLIPVAAYPGIENTKDIETIGIKATLVTSVRVPDEVVYTITKVIFDNLEYFKKLNKAYAGVTRESMLEGLTAPIHPGAMKYYQETGLID